MTLGNFASYVYRRTKTNSTEWGTSGADLVIALNNANEHILSLIRDRSDNFYPTAWTTSDLSTGTATPAFDALFHELVPLWVCYQWAIENEKKTAGLLSSEIVVKERELLSFYATRHYRVATVTIAAPGVFTLNDHGFASDDRVILSTTGTLPTGLSASTWYFVVYLTEHTFSLSLTRAGSSITTTVSQTGTHYVGTELPQRLIPRLDSNK